MWKKLKTAASDALTRARDVAGDATELATSTAGSAAEKAKDLAADVGQVAKTAGRATAGGAKTALSKAGAGLKTASAVTGHGARRAGEGIKNVAQGAATGAAAVGGGVAGTATELGAKAWDKVDDRVESYWAIIKESFIETAGNAIQSAVENDAAMGRIFKATYFVLPTHVRLWVAEEQFMKFCFKNRDRLVGAALQVSAASEVPALPAPNDTRIVDV